MNKLSVCVMSTLANDKYKSQIMGCRETWGKQAEEKDIIVRYFCGNIKDENFSFVTHLDNVGDDYYSATLKQYYGLKYLLKQHPSEFYLIIGTDTYININRVLQMLDKYNYKNSLIIGGYGQTRNIFGYNVFFSLGGGGIFLSHSALKQLAPLFDQLLIDWEIETNKSGYQYLKPACDVSLYHLAWREGITQVIERDIYSCSWAGYFYNNSNIISNNFCGKINVETMISCHFMEREDMLLYQKWGDKGDVYHIIRSKYEKNKDEEIYEQALQNSKINCEENIWACLFGLLNNLNAENRKIKWIHEKDPEIEFLAKQFDITVEFIQY